MVRGPDCPGMTALAPPQSQMDRSSCLGSDGSVKIGSWGIWRWFHTPRVVLVVTRMVWESQEPGFSQSQPERSGCFPSPCHFLYVKDLELKPYWVPTICVLVGTGLTQLLVKEDADLSRFLYILRKTVHGSRVNGRCSTRTTSRLRLFNQGSTGGG